MWQAKNTITRFTKNGAIHTIVGSFLTKFVSFFGSVLIVRFLTKSEYGVLSYYENFISYFIILAGLGLASGLQRYMILAPGPSEKKSCFIRALFRGTVWNIGLVIICVLFFFFFPHPDSFKGYFFVGLALAFCIPFLFCVNACLSTLRAEFDYKSYAFLAFFTTCILIASRVFGAAIGGLSLTTWARLVAEIFCAIICIILVNRRYFQGVQSAPLDKAFIKEMDTYSIQIMLTDGLWAIFMFNDLFLLGLLSGSETIIAEYKVAYVIPANMSILTWAMGIFVAPYFTKHENEKDYDWVKSKFNQVLKMTALIIGVDALLCFVLAKPLILLLFGKEYLFSVPIMKVLLLASFFNNGIRAPIANVLSAMGIQKLNLYVASGGIILQVLLDVLLIPDFGGMGVAWSNSVVYLSMSLMLAYIFWNKYYCGTVYKRTS